MSGSNGGTKSFWNSLLQHFSDFFGDVLEQVEKSDLSQEEKVKLAASLMQAVSPLDTSGEELSDAGQEPVYNDDEDEIFLGKKGTTVGVDVGPTVLVAHAATIAMQALFHAQTAILVVNKALVSSGGTPGDVLAFKLNIYSAARSNFMDGLELLSTVDGEPDKRFPSIIPPVPQVPEGLSGDELIARADRRAELAMGESVQANSRLDLAQMKFREVGNGDAASQVQAAKDLFELACDQLKAGIMGRIPEPDGAQTKSGK